MDIGMSTYRRNISVYMVYLTSIVMKFKKTKKSNREGKETDKTIMIGFPDQKLKSRIHIYIRLSWKSTTKTFISTQIQWLVAFLARPHQAPPETKEITRGKKKKNHEEKKLSHKDEIGWLNSTKMRRVTIDNTTLHRPIIPHTYISMAFTSVYSSRSIPLPFRHLSTGGCFHYQTFKPH